MKVSRNSLGVTIWMPIQIFLSVLMVTIKPLWINRPILPPFGPPEEWIKGEQNGNGSKVTKKGWIYEKNQNDSGPLSMSRLDRVDGDRVNQVLKQIDSFTYYCVVERLLRAHSLPIVMLDLDSIYEKYINTFGSGRTSNKIIK